MQHHELCNAWASYHPYDCPECKVLERKGRLLYTDNDIQEAYENGLAERDDSLYWEHQDELEESYDDGLSAGRLEVMNDPGKYGLVVA